MNDETETRQELATVAETGGDQMLMDPGTFEHAQRVAKLFSSSQLVPKHLQGKPQDCFMALHMAQRLREDPLMVAQNIVIIHGTAGWKATWLIARANRSGVFRGPIKYRYEGEGDSLSVTAYAEMAESGETVEATADMAMAEAEGWAKNPKYQSMPRQMLSYRAASFLVRLYCPEVAMGYQTSEELEDMQAAGKLRDVTPREQTATEALSQLGRASDPEPPMDAPQQSVEESEQQPAPEATATLNVGAVESSPPTGNEQEPAKRSVPLIGPDGDVRGEYQQQGRWLNGLIALLQEHEGDADAMQKIADANRSVIDRIRSAGQQNKKLAEVDNLVAAVLATVSAGDGGTDEWLSDYDEANGGAKDDELLGEIQEGLDELAQAGNAEEIRKRINRAQEIKDDGLRADVLDELDQALTTAQGDT